MINPINIADFISYLYYKRKGLLPPTTLLDGWRTLPPEEIDAQLSGLFQSWGMSELHKREEIKLFLEKTPSEANVPAPTPYTRTPPPTTTPRTVPSSPTRAAAPYKHQGTRSHKVRWLRWLIIPLLLAGLYLGYRYARFTQLEYVYAITNNIVVRDANKQVVAKMDIKDRSNGQIPTVQKLKVYDGAVYYRSIDSSDKTYPCRKVVLNEDDFWAYLTEAEDNVGYVNHTYVVDQLSEFNLYKTVFNDVVKNRAANDDLKAIYRRIIIGSMNQMPALNDNFIVLHDYGLTREAVTRTQAILKETVEKNVSYNLYAGLNDNLYYRFEGDIQTNVYHPPAVLMMHREGENPEPLRGNYRFYTKGAEVLLYDCSEKKYTLHKALRDGSGRITGFQYIEPPQPTFMDHVDSMIDGFKEVVDTLF